MDSNPNEALQLVEQLDAVIRAAKPVPLTAQVRVDRDELLAMLDRVRVSLGGAPKHDASTGWRM
jgi:hypothetical protein